jgi:hypothetical protein
MHADVRGWIMINVETRHATSLAKCAAPSVTSADIWLTITVVVSFVETKSAA